MHIAVMRSVEREWKVEKGLYDTPRHWVLSTRVGQWSVKGFQSGQDMSD